VRGVALIWLNRSWPAHVKASQRRAPHREATTRLESSLVEGVERAYRSAFEKSVSAFKQNLPQLYRFCFLMLGDSSKAQDVFHTTLREAALHAAHGELPNEPFWLFRDARWRCLQASGSDLQAEPLEIGAHELTAEAASQIERLDPVQLAIWISAAPEPQRTALALFYLDEFDYREILDLTELKFHELSRLLALGRRQFQAWLDAMLPQKLDL
jgi:DNA-directed RNA polymerase specialized sigma24 family protein